MRTILFAIACLTLVSCAHVVAPDLRAEADKSLSTDELFKHPDLHKGKTVIVGGVIIGIESTKEGTTLEVLEKPLDSRGRPLETDLSRGRFILEHSKRLDPAIFTPGREITTAAVVLGSETRTLGEMEYPYLMLRSKALYLHRDTARERRIPVHFGFGVFHSF